MVFLCMINYLIKNLVVLYASIYSWQKGLLNGWINKFVLQTKACESLSQNEMKGLAISASKSILKLVGSSAGPVL